MVNSLCHAFVRRQGSGVPFYPSPFSTIKESYFILAFSAIGIIWTKAFCAFKKQFHLKEKRDADPASS
ncbi:hypothetical protein [Shinella sp. DD12]|uniref:hypothetical protein n=1 Tax=Shinella sp. DD12 TaxID=1410620 RepID=UPI0012DFCC71|nr:hypothetical protein [Shinella sp. DD12]